MRAAVFVVFFLLSLSGLAQRTAQRFFNPAAGLAGTFVFSITQDKDNFLWIGTEKGLIKFDGKNFYNMSVLDSTGTDPVTASFTDDQYSYFGFQSGKILRWDGYALDTLLTDRGNHVVNEIQRDNEGNIWFLTSQAGFYRKSKNTDALEHFPVPRLSGILSYDFNVDGQRALVATSEGVMVFDLSDKVSFIQVVDRLDYISCLSIEARDVKGGYWVGTDGDGLYEIKQAEGRWSAAPTTLLPEESIVSLDHMTNGDLWVGTRLNGLVRINFNLTNPKPIQYSYFNKRTGFPSNQIGDIYIDSEENIWVGFLGDGMAQLYERAIQYYELRSQFGITKVNATIQNRDHELFIATDNGLIKGQYLNLSDTLVFSAIDHPLLRNRELTDLEFDLDSSLWIGTKSDGIVIGDQKLDRLTKLDVVIPSIEQLTGIYDLQSDDFGNMWVAAKSLGVVEFDRDKEIADIHNISTGYYHNEIEQLAADRDGNIWTGAHSAGLGIIKVDDTYDMLSKEGIFPSRDVNSVTRDKYGNMWIATQGNGVFEYDGENFVRFNTQDGVLSDFCYAVVEDLNDHIWVSHRTGLTRIDEITGAISIVEKKDGLVEDDFILNSAYHDPEGNIWLGNRSGITFLSSPHKTFQHDILQTHVTNIRIDYTDVHLKEFTKSSDYQSKIPEGLVFPYDQNNLTFDFIAPNLRNPNKNMYQFKLDGIEKTKWTTIKAGNAVTFSNLDPGLYDFLVRQSDNPNFWTDSNIQTVQIRVEQPYWEKWWFKSSEIIILGILSLVAYYWSTHSSNVFIIRLMIYVSVFIVFEYIHTLSEPYIQNYTGAVPVFQVMMNLMLGLALYPAERVIVGYIQRKNKERAIKIEE